MGAATCCWWVLLVFISLIDILSHVGRIRARGDSVRAHAHCSRRCVPPSRAEAPAPTCSALPAQPGSQRRPAAPQTLTPLQSRGAGKAHIQQRTLTWTASEASPAQGGVTTSSQRTLCPHAVDTESPLPRPTEPLRLYHFRFLTAPQQEAGPRRPPTPPRTPARLQAAPTPTSTLRRLQVCCWPDVRGNESWVRAGRAWARRTGLFAALARCSRPLESI